jgi:uncharacterized membrane protein YfcA
MPEFDPSLALVAVLATIAGLVRGFSGFGAGMIFMPGASIILGPKLAVVVLLLLDSVPALPIILPAMKIVSWRTVMPTILGYGLLVNVGVWYLVHGDTEVLRWAMSGVIFSFVAILWSGWRWDGPRPTALSVSVGGVSGFLGGAMQLSGLPVMIYWLAGRDPSVRIRANIIGFFLASSVLAAIAFWWNGLFVREILAPLAICTPLYAGGLYIGQRFFSGSSEAGYRRFTLILILCVAVTSLPIFDGVLRQIP